MADEEGAWTKRGGEEVEIFRRTQKTWKKKTSKKKCWIIL
jgi:hypothetical protein